MPEAFLHIFRLGSILVVPPFFDVVKAISYQLWEVWLWRCRQDYQKPGIDIHVTNYNSSSQPQLFKTAINLQSGNLSGVGLRTGFQSPWQRLPHKWARSGPRIIGNLVVFIVNARSTGFGSFLRHGTLEWGCDRTEGENNGKNVILSSCKGQTASQF